MPDRTRFGIIYEINTWVWLEEWSRAAGRQLTLSTLPGEAWDQLASVRPGAVWLMGVWERSRAGRKLALRHSALRKDIQRQLKEGTDADIVGSPYCIRQNRVDPFLGGTEGLAAARQALAQRGLGLFLDFVPNHIAPDHPWVTSHPEWLLRGSETDLQRHPQDYLKVGDRIFAHGRDPFFPPWSDVLQLNLFHSGLRQAWRNELRTIAEQCDGVRCDMAMLVLNEVFAKTWGSRPGPVPAQDFWMELIPELRKSHPDFCFIAEAYWDLELRLLEHGFDACYDKRLYDALAHGSAETVRLHLSRTSSVQDRLVRFLENHDEPRAATVFPGAKGQAAAVVLLTLPGWPLLHDGQMEGRQVRTLVHAGRRAPETTDVVLRQFYAGLLQATRTPAFQNGEWRACQTVGWPDNASHQHLLAWTWQHSEERWVVIVNYSAERAQGRVRVPGLAFERGRYRLLDVFQNVTYERAADELMRSGLFVDLSAWGFHLLQFDPSSTVGGDSVGAAQL